MNLKRNMTWRILVVLEVMNPRVTMTMMKMVMFSLEALQYASSILKCENPYGRHFFFFFVYNRGE